MPFNFNEELKKQDAAIVRFLLEMTKRYLRDHKQTPIVDGYTYENYLKAKQYYLDKNDLSETNRYDSENQFPVQENPISVENVLNTEAIINARAKGNGRIVALNLANANRPLGAATFARHGTQEEYFAHNSSLFLDIYEGLEDKGAKNAIMAIYFNLFFDCYGNSKEVEPTKQEWADAHEEIRKISKNAGYSLHGDTAHLSENVIFFATEKKNIGARMYHEIPEFQAANPRKLVIADVVSAAAFNLNLLTSDPDVDQIFSVKRKDRLERTRAKIEKIFEVARIGQTNFCILGALGCGAFKNPAGEIARVFNVVIRQLPQKYEELKNRMPPISFAIFGTDKSTVENRTVFEHTFSESDQFSSTMDKIRENLEKLGLSTNEAAENLIAEFESSYMAYDNSDLIDHANTLNLALDEKLTDNPNTTLALRNLDELANRLKKTHNYKALGIAMMAVGAVLTAIGSLAIAAGVLVIPSGVAALPGFAAVTLGSYALAGGLGLFSSGVKKFRSRDEKSALRERGNQLANLSEALKGPSQSN